MKPRDNEKITGEANTTRHPTPSTDAWKQIGFIGTGNKIIVIVSGEYADGVRLPIHAELQA